MNTNSLDLESIEINPTAPSEYSVIWLHGLGADGNDFVPIVPELKLPEKKPTRFIFPHAPVIPVSLNNGYEMRAWFDMHGITHDAKLDKEGIRKAINAINRLIDIEIERGVKSEQIFLAGFSQGAATAL